VASHILPNARLADLAYNAIIAIASSAFMMTLYRKRIIRGMSHMVMYSGKFDCQMDVSLYWFTGGALFHVERCIRKL